MSNKILVPIIRNDICEDAIRLANQWGIHNNSEFYFLHVTKQGKLIFSDSEEKSRLITENREQIEEFLKQQKISAKYHLTVCSGPSKESIIHEEERVHPDFILMPSSYHSLLSRALHESNTDYVVHHSKTSIYVYRKRVEAFRNLILVPIDLASTNSSLIQLADDWAIESGAELCLVHFTDFEEYFGKGKVKEIDYNNGMARKLMDDLQEHFRQFVASLHIKSAYRQKIVVGKGYQELITLQKQLKPKLIMIGTHTYPQADKHADYLLHHTNCSLFIHKNS